MTRNLAGYGKLSIWLHWVTVVLLVALFVTHEGQNGDAAYAFHVGVGALAAVFFVWRVLRRFTQGFAEKPQQSSILNFLAKLVLWNLLLALIVLSLSGVILPWSLGQPLDIYGIAIPSPIARNGALHEIMEETHDFAGHIVIPLLILHILGVIKHALLDDDASIAKRMISPVRGGR